MIRVERPRAGFPIGEGVYSTDEGWQTINRWRKKENLDLDSDGVMTSDPKFHPSPERDSKLGPTWYDLIGDLAELNYYFGFADMAQFRQWFYNDEVLKELESVGYKVVEYETDGRYYEGYTQVICHKNDMKFKRIINPFKD